MTPRRRLINTSLNTGCVMSIPVRRVVVIHTIRTIVLVMGQMRTFAPHYV